MEELKKIHGFAEKAFYTFWFWFFLMWLFVRNDYLANFSKSFLISLDLPFIFIAIVYWLLSIALRLQEKEWQVDYVLNGVLILAWASVFMLILFVFLAFPNKI